MKTSERFRIGVQFPRKHSSGFVVSIRPAAPLDRSDRGAAESEICSRCAEAEPVQLDQGESIQ